MLKYNGSILRLPSKAILDYVPPTYTRFMWRFDGHDSSSDNYWQMSKIEINDVSRPYTYITSYLSASVIYNVNYEGPEQLLNTGTNKWCFRKFPTSGYGWIIFDIPIAVNPLYYRLLTSNDTGNDPTRNPNRNRLYASLGTPTTFDDPSWVLLADYGKVLPTTSNTWWTGYMNQGV